MSRSIERWRKSFVRILSTVTALFLLAGCCSSGTLTPQQTASVVQNCPPLLIPPQGDMVMEQAIREWLYAVKQYGNCRAAARALMVEELKK